MRPSADFSPVALLSFSHLKMAPSHGPAPKGIVLQRGESPLDGSPFVVILTTKSGNRKTGDMCQVWILREDQDPVAAIASGADFTVCGNCPHRKQADGSRSCYVNVGQAPLSVWRTYKRGGYVDSPSAELLARVLRGRRIRWGAYGDPSIISPDVVALCNEHADGWTGYTHQWRQPFAQWCRGTFQASCDGFADYLAASDAGWRTFAVVPKNGAAFSGKQCPATVAGSEATCRTCSLCDGAKADIWVEAHGAGAKHFDGVTAAAVA